MILFYQIWFEPYLTHGLITVNYYKNLHLNIKYCPDGVLKPLEMIDEALGETLAQRDTEMAEFSDTVTFRRFAEMGLRWTTSVLPSGLGLMGSCIVLCEM